MILNLEAGRRVPNCDRAGQKQVRGTLKTLGATLPDLRHAFGAKGEVDPIRQLIATATAWGGNPYFRLIDDLVAK